MDGEEAIGGGESEVDCFGGRETMGEDGEDAIVTKIGTFRVSLSLCY